MIRQAITTSKQTGGHYAVVSWSWPQIYNLRKEGFPDTKSATLHKSVLVYMIWLDNERYPT